MSITINIGELQSNRPVSDYVFPNAGVYSVGVSISDSLGGLTGSTNWDWDNWWPVLSGTATYIGTTRVSWWWTNSGGSHTAYGDVIVTNSVTVLIGQAVSQNISGKVPAGQDAQGFAASLSNTLGGLSVAVQWDSGGTWMQLSGTPTQKGSTTATLSYTQNGISKSGTVTINVVRVPSVIDGMLKEGLYTIEITTADGKKRAAVLETVEHKTIGGVEYVYLGYDETFALVYEPGMPTSVKVPYYRHWFVDPERSDVFDAPSPIDKLKELIQSNSITSPTGYRCLPVEK